MTNAELLAKIKAEIERLIEESDFDESANLYSLLSFLSTLESEKSRQDGLKEEIESYWKENGPMSHAEYDRLAKCARHFVKWQKEQDEISKVNYEGARAVYDNTVQHLQEKIDEKYELGKKDMKEQMMKEAVEGEVYKFGEVAYVKERNNAELTKYLSQFNNGDRVKIIVIHETDIR
jgi:hypothetical protein